MSAHKSTKAELGAIYRLEFYRQKKNWKLCQDVSKEKDKEKEKDSKETKPSKTKRSKKKSASEIEIPTKRLLNEPDVVDKPVPASEIDEALLESDSGTNVAKETKTQSKVVPTTAAKDKPTGWTLFSRNIALTTIPQSEATPPDVPPHANSEELALMDVSTWPEPRYKPRQWTVDAGDGRPVKVWSKEDQIWLQSPTSWPEPDLWRDNELIWPSAMQQQPAKEVDDTDVIRPAATPQEPAKPDGESKLLWAAMRQGPKVRPKKLVWTDDSHQQPVEAVNDADLIWPTATHQEPTKPMEESERFRGAVGQQDWKGGLTKLWPDNCQQGAGSSVVQWSSDSRRRERWDTIRGWTEDDPRQLEPALSPEVLVSAAEEWLHEPLAQQDDVLDSCLHGCVSRSMCEFTRGAHCRKHSSVIDLSITRELSGAQPPGALSRAALCSCVPRHAGLLQALLCETRAQDQLSAELDDYARSYEEFPTREVGLHGPRVPPHRGTGPPNQGTCPPNQVTCPLNQVTCPPNQGPCPPKQFHRPPNRGPIYDDFVSGSFLNDPCFDLESSSTISVSPRGACADVNRSPCLGFDFEAPGRGRGRLVEPVIGIGPGGRPYRL